MSTVFLLEEQTVSAAPQLIKAFLGLLGVMFLIYLVTELTPHAAKLTDKLLGKVFRNYDGLSGNDDKDNNENPDNNNDGGDTSTPQD